MRQRLKIQLSEAKTTARTLAKTLRGGEILALIGPLGAGKTTFTQALGRALGIRRRITSPTFILLQKFAGRLPEKSSASLVGKQSGKPRAATASAPDKSKFRKSKKPIILYHLDLYRTRGWREVQQLGLGQLWGRPNTITVIEWANKIRRNLPPSTIYIYLRHD